MLLSIGMIVKNEEKYLDRCLTALKPILKNIDSELIIADTGSTDNTVEIAKKHTNNVLDFKWCNDFSAARNFTLEHSKGKWFMYIDADEILENADEIIKFFNNYEYKNFDCARYLYKNYISKNDKIPKEIYLFRMYNIKKGMKFEGIIHEHINDISNCKTFKNTIINHYGYSFENLHEAKLKALRNINLLNAQIKNGNDCALTRNQLCDSYGLYKNYYQVVTHAKEGLKLLNKDNNISAIKIALFFNLISGYYNLKMFEDAIKTFKNYSKKDLIISTDIDIYFIISFCYYKIDDYNNSLLYFKKYSNLYKKNKVTELNTFETSLRPILFSNDNSYFDIKKLVIKSLKKAERYKELLDFYIQNNYFIDNEYIDDIKPFINTYLLTIKKMKKYKYIITYYKNILKSKNLELLNIFEEILEYFILNNNKDKLKITSTFNTLPLTNNYIQLMKIRYAFYTNQKQELTELINIYLSNKIFFDLKNNDILYYIIKENIIIKNTQDLLTSLNLSDLNKIIKQLILKYEDFVLLLNNFNYTCNSIITISIIRLIYNYTLINIDNCTEGHVIDIYHKLLEVSNLYISTLYKNEVINKTNILLTTKDIQFAYLCLVAEENLKQNKKIEYIKNLKSALHCYPEMKNIILKLLNDFENNNKIYDNDFNNLAKTIKTNIINLLNNKNIQAAKNVLDEYKKLNPNDDEIIILEQKMKG